MITNYASNKLESSSFECPRSDVGLKRLLPSEEQEVSCPAPKRRKSTEEKLAAQGLEILPITNENLVLEHHSYEVFPLSQRLISAVSKGDWGFIEKWVDYFILEREVRVLQQLCFLSNFSSNLSIDFSFDFSSNFSIADLACVRDNDQEVPFLWEAANQNQWDIVAKLLLNDFGPDAIQKPEDLPSIFLLAAKKSQWLICSLILIKNTVDRRNYYESVLNCLNNSRQNRSVPLNLITESQSHSMRISNLNAGDEYWVNIEKFSDQMELATVLTLAINHGNIFFADSLMRYKPDVNQIVQIEGFPNGVTPFWLSLHKESYLIARQMLTLEPDFQFTPSETGNHYQSVLTCLVSRLSQPLDKIIDVSDWSPVLKNMSKELTHSLNNDPKLLLGVIKSDIPEVRKFIFSTVQAIGSDVANRVMRTLCEEEQNIGRYFSGITNILDTDPELPIDTDEMFKRSLIEFPNTRVLKWFLSKRQFKSFQEIFDFCGPLIGAKSIKWALNERRYIQQVNDFNTNFPLGKLDQGMESGDRIVHWISKLIDKPFDFEGGTFPMDRKAIEATIGEIDQTDLDEFIYLGQRDLLKIKFLISKEWPRQPGAFSGNRKSICLKSDHNAYVEVMGILFNFHSSLERLQYLFEDKISFDHSPLKQIPREIRIEIAYQALVDMDKDFLYYSPRFVNSVLDRYFSFDSKARTEIIIQKLTMLFCRAWRMEQIEKQTTLSEDKNKWFHLWNHIHANLSNWAYGRRNRRGEADSSLAFDKVIVLARSQEIKDRAREYFKNFDFDLKRADASRRTQSILNRSFRLASKKRPSKDMMRG